MGAGCLWCPTRTAPSATSSRRPSTLYSHGLSWRSIRRSFDLLLRRPHRNPRAWSKKRERLESEAARAGVAHLVERNLPKVEVAGSRPVARSRLPPDLIPYLILKHSWLMFGRTLRGCRRLVSI